MKKLLAAAVGAVLVAAPLAASARDHGGWDHHDRNNGAGAFVAGALLGTALTGGYGYGNGYGNSYGYGYGYGPRYGYRHYPRCYWTSQPVYHRWGGVSYREVEVCR